MPATASRAPASRTGRPWGNHSHVDPAPQEPPTGEPGTGGSRLSDRQNKNSPCTGRPAETGSEGRRRSTHNSTVTSTMTCGMAHKPGRSGERRVWRQPVTTVWWHPMQSATGQLLLRWGGGRPSGAGAEAIAERTAAGTQPRRPTHARASTGEEGARVRGCQPRAGTTRPVLRSGGFVERKRRRVPDKESRRARSIPIPKRAWNFRVERVPSRLNR